MNLKIFFMLAGFVTLQLPAMSRLRSGYTEEIKRECLPHDLQIINSNEFLLGKFLANDGRVLKDVFKDHREIFAEACQYLRILSCNPSEYQRVFSFLDPEFQKNFNHENELRNQDLNKHFTSLKNSSQRIRTLAHLAEVVQDYNVILIKLKCATEFQIAHHLLHGITDFRHSSQYIQKITKALINYAGFNQRLINQRTQFKRHLDEFSPQ